MNNTKSEIIKILEKHKELPKHQIYRELKESGVDHEVKVSIVAVYTDISALVEEGVLNKVTKGLPLTNYYSVIKKQGERNNLGYPSV